MSRVDRAAIEERIKVYHEQTQPLFTYLEETLDLPLIHVSWADAPGDVYAQILTHLAPHL
jgi:adenylate kinase family enzyme